MSTVGFGVMLQHLFGSRGGEACHKCIGRTIAKASLEGDSEFVLEFRDNSTLTFRDEGQSCCEHRYMSLDGDDLTYFTGSTFLKAELRDGGSGPAKSECEHEIQFLVISTSVGDITISNHNEHNGYYGGFLIRCELRQASRA